MHCSRDQLLADASLYVQKLDLIGRRALLLRLSRAGYAEASFLDDRILTSASQTMWVKLDDLAKALAGATPQKPLHFIFHAGHVGSTLLSRLLDSADGVLGLREPLPLRTLAEIHDDLRTPQSPFCTSHFDALVREQCVLWARGFPDTQACIVKATSATARLGPELLRALPEARAVYLKLPLEPYLATLLAGENSLIDLRGHAAERMRRLARFDVNLITPAQEMSIGELAAMSWLAERVSESALVQAAGERLVSMNFEHLLASPESSLRRICTHLQLAAQEDFFSRIIQNPVWLRYSKAPEHTYSPGDRAQILAQARYEKAEEIQRGLAWANDVNRRSSVDFQI